MVALLFYFFGFCLLLSAVLVICGKSVVHSALSLVLSFVMAAAILLLISAEYIALLLVVIYVGAVAVLFLFVIMMVNRNVQGADISRKLCALLVVCSFTFLLSTAFYDSRDYITINGFSDTDVENMAVSSVGQYGPYQVGYKMYTEYVLHFELAAVLLLVAIVGAIMLAMRKRGRNIQDVDGQLSRRARDAVVSVDVESYKGVDKVS